MKTLRPHILIVGNNPTQSDLLGSCLDALGILPIGPATTPTTAIALYAEHLPNLVMMNAAVAPALAEGIALAQQLLLVRHTPFVFLTETVAEATAIRRQMPQVVCVTKPYSAAYLQRVIQVVLAQSSLAEGMVLPALVATEVLGAVLHSPHLFVRERGMLIRLEPALIACVETDGKYCLITVASGHRYTARVPLRELLRLLAPAHFVRVHRSWMVNLQYIDRIDPVEGTIHLLGGVEVPLGRAHKEAFFKELRFVD